MLPKTRPALLKSRFKDCKCSTVWIPGKNLFAGVKFKKPTRYEQITRVDCKFLTGPVRFLVLPLHIMYTHGRYTGTASNTGFKPVAVSASGKKRQGYHQTE